jgi:hypothetical protein
MRSWHVLIGSIGLAAGLGASAWAQSNRTIELGHELYEAQEYDAAREQFMEAYEESPSPALLFEIALTYQGEGLFRQAQLYFERFAAEAPQGDPNRGEALRLAENMKLAADRGDAPPEGGSDRLLPLFGDTGRSEDEPMLSDREEDEGPSKARTARILFWTSAVVAAAAATTLIISAYNVDHYEDELNAAVHDSLSDFDPENRIEGDGDACDVAHDRSGIYAERAQNACDHGKAWARTANIMTVGLITTGITSMYFLYVGYLKDRPHDDEEDDEDAAIPKRRRSVVVSPTIGPDQVGLGLEMRF